MRKKAVLRAMVTVALLVVGSGASMAGSICWHEPETILDQAQDHQHSTGAIEGSKFDNGLKLALSGGDVFSVWNIAPLEPSIVDDSKAKQIAFQAKIDGVWQPNTTILDDIKSCARLTPVIASAPNGDIHVAYRGARQGSTETPICDLTDYCDTSSGTPGTCAHSGATCSKDRQCCDCIFDIYHTYSTDNGENWSDPLAPLAKVSDVSSNMADEESGKRPFIAVDPVSGDVYVSYDHVTSSGTGRIQYRRLASNGTGYDPAWSEQGQVSTSSFEMYSYSTSNSCEFTMEECDTNTPYFDDAEFADMFIQPSGKNGPKGHSFLIDPTGEVHFLFKVDPHEEELQPLVAANAPTLQYSETCSSVADIDEVYYKKGIWSDTRNAFDWWGLYSNWMPGTDVRVSTRSLEWDPPMDINQYFYPPEFPQSFIPVPLNTPVMFSSKLPDSSIARTPDGEIYAFFSDFTPFGYEEHCVVNKFGTDAEIWVRRLSDNGVSKSATVNAVSRTQWNIQNMDDPEISRRDESENPSAVGGSTVDGSGIVHVIYERHSGEARSSSLTYWESPYHKIYYATQQSQDAEDSWDYEIPISKAPLAAAHPSITIAADGNVHAIWTESQPNTTEVQKNVVYSFGEAITSLADGETATWDGTVYLDQDFKVEAGATLTISAGTRVFTATNQDRNDLDGPSDANSIEILVEGTLLVNGTAADPVTFTSSKAWDPGEWYGIVVRGPQALAVIDGAEISHAMNPVSLLTVANSVVQNSIIHSGGEIGIYAVNSSPLTIDANVIDAQDTAGIRLEYGFHDCLQASSSPHAVIISDNVVTGSGVVVGGPHTTAGLDVIQGCAPGQRTVDILRNSFTSWDGPGVRLVDSADLTFSCNKIEFNDIAVDFSRASNTLGGDVIFQSNLMASDSDGSGLIKTDNAFDLRLGETDVFGAGRNILDLDDTATQYLILQDGTTSTDRLDVLDNFWQFAGTAVTNPTLIEAEFEGGAAAILLEPLANGLKPPCINSGNGGGSQSNP